MQMRLLNLDRSSDRLALFRARNPHLAGIERVSAVDGRLADRRRLIEHGIMSPDLNYSDGAVGCAMSHLTQWRDAAQGGEPLTIIEDDAVLCANFEEESARVLAGLPDDWEYVMWGFNFDAPLTFHLGEGLSPCTSAFDQAAMRQDIRNFASRRVSTMAFRLLRGFGTVCYSISPRGAMRLVEFCLPLRPMDTMHPGLAHRIANAGIDNMLARVWPEMAAYVAVPPLALTENDHRVSTIQAAGTPQPPAQKVAFPEPDAFAAVFERIGVTNAVAVGIRSDHYTVLPTAALRRVGWGGFDIAEDASLLARALTERGIEQGFDLLFLGTADTPVPSLCTLLGSFRPRAVVVPADRDEAQRPAPAEAGRRGPPRLSMKQIAAGFGYSTQPCPEADGYLLLLRQGISWEEPAEPGVAVLA